MWSELSDSFRSYFRLVSFYERAWKWLEISSLVSKIGQTVSLIFLCMFFSSKFFLISKTKIFWKIEFLILSKSGIIKVNESLIEISMMNNVSQVTEKLLRMIKTVRKKLWRHTKYWHWESFSKLDWIFWSNKSDQDVSEKRCRVPARSLRSRKFSKIIFPSVPDI